MDTQYCRFCGRPLSQGAMFCANCGKPVESSGASTGTESSLENSPESSSENSQSVGEPTVAATGSQHPVVERAGDPLASQGNVEDANGQTGAEQGGSADAAGVNAQSGTDGNAANGSSGTNVASAVNNVVDHVAPVVNNVVDHVAPVVKAAGRQAAQSVKKMDRKSTFMLAVFAVIMVIALFGGGSFLLSSHRTNDADQAVQTSQPAQTEQSQSESESSQSNTSETPQSDSSTSSDESSQDSQSTQSSASQAVDSDFTDLWQSVVDNADMTRLAGTYCRQDGACVKLVVDSGDTSGMQRLGSLSFKSSGSSPLPDGASQSALGFQYQSAQPLPSVKTPISMLAGCQGSAGCETGQTGVYFMAAGTGLDFFSQQYDPIPVDSSHLPDSSREYLIIADSNGPEISDSTVFYRKN